MFCVTSDLIRSLFNYFSFTPRYGNLTLYGGNGRVNPYRIV